MATADTATLLSRVKRAMRRLEYRGEVCVPAEEEFLGALITACTASGQEASVRRDENGFIWVYLQRKW